MADEKTKTTVTLGRCKICGGPIEVAAWVAKILQKKGIEPQACSRAHADMLLEAKYEDEEA